MKDQSETRCSICEARRAEHLRMLSEACVRDHAPEEEAEALKTILGQLEDWNANGLSNTFKILKQYDVHASPDTIIAFVLSGIWKTLGYHRVEDALKKVLQLDDNLAKMWSDLDSDNVLDRPESGQKFLRERGAE